MQVYTGKIEACADLMAEVYENMFTEYAWACVGTDDEQIPMEFPVDIHLNQD